MNLVSLLTHQKVVAGNNGGQAVTDVSAYTRQGKFLMSAKSDAGTNPTLAVKLQGSSSMVNANTMASTTGDTLADVGHRTGATTNIKLAAKFELAANATVAKVLLPLKKTGAPTGTLTLEIYADTAGDPSGSALATAATLDVSTLATSYGTTEFTFAIPTDLAAGTYHIVISSNVATSGSVFVSWRSITRGSGGNANIYGTAWVPTDTADLEFRLYTYTFTDITGLGFTGATSTATTQMLESNVDKLAVIRPHITVGGTNTPAFYVTVAGLLTPVQP